MDTNSVPGTEVRSCVSQLRSSGPGTNGAVRAEQERPITMGPKPRQPGTHDVSKTPTAKCPPVELRGCDQNFLEPGTDTDIDPGPRGPWAVDLTHYGKPAFRRLPAGLGKPAAGFPQLHSLDDGETSSSQIRA